jgi:hypothetical protein
MVPPGRSEESGVTGQPDPSDVGDLYRQVHLGTVKWQMPDRRARVSLGRRLARRLWKPRAK